MEAIAVELAIEAVKFLVGRFIQQLDEHKLLIDEAAVRMEELERDNKFLTEYLEDAVNKRKSNNLIDRTLLREVRDSVFKAEDAIDSFAFQVADRESKWYSGISKSTKPVLEIAQLIKSVAESVNKIRQKVEERDKDTAHATENERLPEYEGEPPIQEYGPIFEEEEKRVRQRLIGEAKQPDVIFITGTHGIGKTTLAAKMFHDSKMRKEFNKHIWVSVHNPTPKNILLVVLRRLNKLPDDVPIPKIIWELCDQVASCLEGEKFLLVIDNVPEMSKEDFTRLRSAFVKSDERSKILITSNNDDLAVFVGDDSHIKLNPLGLVESWSLLQWRVFSGGPCPHGLERPGKLIAANCNGLPQKIDFAGDALAEKNRHSKEPARRKKEWDDFSEGIIPFTLSSYYKMPYHLRACFLYLGIFPRKSNFSVSKLAHMWIAEGFIPRRPDATLEETAQEYLMELVKRNLVSIEEKRLDGSAKTCSINELVYNFCKKESAAEGENFLQEFRKYGPEGFYPPIDEVKKNRRVCIHAHISHFIQNLISSRHHTFKIGLRSFVSHSDTDEFTLHGKNISIIRAAFKLLRVLDAKPIKVNKIHRDLCLLVHLRYVTLSLNGDVLPEAISKLRNMQTLTVHTTSCTLKIEADILKMVELRHFQTNASATLPKKSNASREDERLQTLCGISPKSCTQEFFSKLPNLKKLGICGQLGLLLLDGKNELLSKLVKVQKLKLLNQVTSPKDEGDLSSLLHQPSQFPPNLRSLTLSATSLDWKHISILGSLQELEELKLKNDAFVGDKWEVHDEGFPNLKTLKIESLHLIQWKSSSTHFPKLRRLMLSKCEKLREIPVELADIPTFQELHLRNANQSAAECANAILKDKLYMKQKDNNIMFDLSFDD